MMKQGIPQGLGVKRSNQAKRQPGTNGGGNTVNITSGRMVLNTNLGESKFDSFNLNRFNI